MLVGDVAIPIRGTTLFCGSGTYTHAIVASVEPFVLMSEEADMRWDQHEHYNFQYLCKADSKIVKRCLKRLKEGY
jgi:hypothetical protein